MTLFSSLSTASTALQAFSNALGADQTNVSNSTTPGFAAIRAIVNPIDANGSTGGITADSVTLQSTGSPQADARVQSATSEANASQTTANQLAPLNQLFDITGSTGILAAFQAFSTAFSSLSVTPNDPTLRAAALSAAGSVASAFQSAAASLDSNKASIDSQIGTTITSINDLSTQISKFNVAVRSSAQVDAGTDAGLRSALDQLSALTDISVTKNSDGTISVLTGGQQPLVVGDRAYTLSANLSAAEGSQISSSGGGGSPVSYSGQLGALLNVRNGALQDILGGNGVTGSLNDLAQGFASQVNSLVGSGTTSSGAPGSPVFVWDTTDSTNVARTLSVSPSLTTDQLALASTGTTGASNGIATALAALPSSTAAASLVDGLSPQGLFASIAAGVGRQLSDAQTQSTSDQSTLTSAQNSRQQVSGVSLDQEAVNITSYQRSYSAEAQVVSILNQLTEDEVNLLK